MAAVGAVGAPQWGAGTLRSCSRLLAMLLGVLAVLLGVQQLLARVEEEEEEER